MIAKETIYEIAHDAAKDQPERHLAAQGVDVEMVPGEKENHQRDKSHHGKDLVVAAKHAPSRARVPPMDQAEKFRTEGAIGSHLENLERNQGFKGFNQTGVSEIISATDPRKQ